MGAIIGVFIASAVYAVIASSTRDHYLQVQICQDQRGDEIVDQSIAAKLNIVIPQHRTDGC